MVARDIRSPRVRVARPGLPEAPLAPCHTGLPRPGEPVTEKHMERALEIMAEVVVQHGDWALPLYVKVETELEAMRQRRSPMDRARALLAAKAADAAKASRAA